jgi:hypothetical protein
MCLYSRWVLPHLLDLALRNRVLNRYRQRGQVRSRLGAGGGRIRTSVPRERDSLFSRPPHSRGGKEKAPRKESPGARVKHETAALREGGDPNVS